MISPVKDFCSLRNIKVMEQQARKLTVHQLISIWENMIQNSYRAAIADEVIDDIKYDNITTVLSNELNERLPKNYALLIAQYLKDFLNYIHHKKRIKTDIGIIIKAETIFLTTNN